MGEAWAKASPDHQAFANWDGHFYKQDRAPVVFYLLAHRLWQGYLERYKDDPLMFEAFQGNGNWKVHMLEWLGSASESEIRAAVEKSYALIGEDLETFKVWGDLTHQRKTSVFGMIPWIGSRFDLGSHPINGSSDTVNKVGRSLSNEKSEITYGVSARHISDMSSMDENYFIMNGGQDSWLNNDNLANQSELFRNGKYLKLPLTMSKVRQEFRAHTTQIHPSGT